MNTFLRGFTSELTKLADGDTWQALGTTAGQQPRPASGIVRPPSTGTAGAPAPRPTNAFAPTGAFGSAIPTQKLESPAAATPPTWRPSPGYKPKPGSDPTTPPPTRHRGGGGTGRGSDDVPWENAATRGHRIVEERRYNEGLADKKKGEAKAKTDAKADPWANAGAGYRLTPFQMSKRKKSDDAAARAKASTLAQKAKATQAVRNQNADADSALAGGAVTAPRSAPTTGGPVLKRER